MNNKVLAERLKSMRKSKKITQKELSDELGVALSVIAGAETKTGISKSLATKLCKYFNTPLEYWINENADIEFIKNHDLFETTEMVVRRLIDENLITLDNIDKVPKDEIDLLERSLLFDIKVYLTKKEG